MNMRQLIGTLAIAAGTTLSGTALAQAVQQDHLDQSDPVVRSAVRRLNPMPGAGDAAGPDVIVGEIQNSGSCCPDTESVMINPATTVGGVVAYGLGTSSCNIGTVNLLWRSQTPYHPIIPQNLYRLKTVNGSTRFEQLGQSWSKYAFTALTFTVCGGPCSAGGSVLGPGCSDPYSASLNYSQSSLGPRYQCNPFTGDYPDGSAVRAAWPGVADGLSRRLRVNAADLSAASNPGALYFGESLYISRDDHCWGNSKNNASYRRCVVGGGNALTLQGAIGGNGTQRGIPAIFAWRDHGGGANTPDPSVMITEVTCGNTFFTQPAYPYNGAQGAGTTLVLPAGDGWVYVASRATDLGGGVWHYEYAVENLNSDRGIGSFRINFPAGTAITNAESRLIDCHSGVAAEDANRNTPWSQTISSDNITWSTPHTYSAATPQLGSYLRWGTTYNFRFDANVAPATGGNAVLGYFKPLATYVDTINAAAHVPGSAPPGGCYADCDGVGGLTANDFACFLNAYSQGQSYANCDGVGGLTPNDFACFLNEYSNGCS
jgi:hypothetical protein